MWSKYTYGFLWVFYGFLNKGLGPLIIKQDATLCMDLDFRLHVSCLV